MSTPRSLARRHGHLPLALSFEYFPPKTPDAFGALADAADRLDSLRPEFVSVTYGAGGGEQSRSIQTIEELQAVSAAPVAAHLTCVGASRSDVDQTARGFYELGVRHFVALRGDCPGGAYASHPDGYSSTAELVRALRQQLGDVEVSVSAYPERHPDSPSIDHDLDVLAEKVDAGATRAITQFFFDNDRYHRYVERARERGLHIPIIPGILPIRDLSSAKRFAARCGAEVPPWLVRRFADSVQADSGELVGVACAVEQVIDLADAGVDHFHFYTLNRADMTAAVCAALGRTARSRIRLSA